jgi:hypothetical protein
VAQQALEGADLFTSSSVLSAALRNRYCMALDAARRARRGGEGQLGGGFDACPAIGELTVLVGSADGRTLDRLTLYAGPYVAGPYAEGAYAIDIPVNAAVLASVKPQYREAFGVP